MQAWSRERADPHSLRALARVLLVDLMAYLASRAIQYLSAVSEWLNPDETEAHRLRECEDNSTLDLPLMPQALGERGLLPGPLDQRPGTLAVASQVISPREHTALWLLGGSHDRHHPTPPRRANAGEFRRRFRRRHTSDTCYGCAQLQSSRTSQALHGPTSRIHPYSSCSTRRTHTGRCR